MRTHIRSRIRCGIAGIHKLHLARARICQVGGEGDLQPTYRFKRKLKIEFLVLRHQCRRYLIAVGYKPATVLSLLHEIITVKSEREVKTRCHRTVFCALSEDITYIGREQRQIQRMPATPTEGERPRHHQETQAILREFRCETCFLRFRIFTYHELNASRASVKDLD